MIALGVSHQTSNDVLCHYVVCNITKFQSCRSDNNFIIGNTPSGKHFDKNNMSFASSSVLKFSGSRKLSSAYHMFNSLGFTI